MSETEYFCVNYKWKERGWLPHQLRWIAPDVVEILAKWGVTATADEVETLLRKNDIRGGSSSDPIVSDYLARKYAELVGVTGHEEPYLDPIVNADWHGNK